MKRIVLSCVALGALCASSVPASAQERGNVGLVIAMPTDIGVIWHVNENIAVRPEINFSFGSGEIEAPGGVTSETSGRGYSLETSVLFYLGAIDGVRTYVSPRIGFDWTSSDDNDSDDDISGNAMEVSLSYGAEYAPVPRFSIFGEIGLEYGRATAELDSVASVESRASMWGPRTQVGVILYLGRD